MKKMTFVLAVVAALASCGNPEHHVKLRNGSVVMAQEAHGRLWGTGDTVCVYRMSGYGDPWIIENGGKMEDTIIYRTYIRESDGKKAGYTMEWRIGVIK